MDDFNDKLNKIMLLSLDIEVKLKNKIDISQLIDIISIRNKCVTDLIEQSSDENKKIVISKLLVIRDNEESLLIPYRFEFELIKKTINNLNHLKKYYDELT